MTGRHKPLQGFWTMRRSTSGNGYQSPPAIGKIFFLATDDFARLVLPRLIFGHLTNETKHVRVKALSRYGPPNSRAFIQEGDIDNALFGHWSLTLPLKDEIRNLLVRFIIQTATPGKSPRRSECGRSTTRS